MITVCLKPLGCSSIKWISNINNTDLCKIYICLAIQKAADQQDLSILGSLHRSLNNMFFKSVAKF